MTAIVDYHSIMTDRETFNGYVYTPLSEALRLLEERLKDEDLKKKVVDLLGGDIPECFKDGERYAVLFRQIATPNHEGRHFISLAQENDLHPVFFEYFDDKFTSNNEFKHSLGQLHVQSPVNKNGSHPVEKITIVDFNQYNGKAFKEIKTLEGQLLIDFHRNLFKTQGFNIETLCLYDASQWFKRHGPLAGEYYSDFFLLFTCFGILFENFLVNEKEGAFTKDVVLPAIQKVMEMTGVRPLIVPMQPLDIEDDMHWISYHSKIKN